MPRPGPRPYECVRRAWHSDRHRPMRGSIIQQIFRVVYETHSPVTKKNKEWQEKLPIVVLRAEEIMYSKANSEAEYLNLDTLWDRANYAIDTIIRRDESSETGELLPPCVEAALILGCVAVKASRSQRHSNPRTYLTPRAQEIASTPSGSLHNTTDEKCPMLLPLHSNPLNFPRTTTENSNLFVSESNTQLNQNNNHIVPHNYSFPLENVPVVHNQFSNLGSVYPLYYGTHYQPKENELSARIPDAHTETIFLGRPIITSHAEPSEKNFLSSKSAGNASKSLTFMNVMNTNENVPEAECDLSLRLGVPDHYISADKCSGFETEDVGSSCSQEGSKINDQYLRMNNYKEFCFFNKRTGIDRFEACSSMWNLEGSSQNLEAAKKKRKAPFSNNKEDGQFCRRIEGPGL